MSAQSAAVMVYSSKRRSVFAEMRQLFAHRELLLVFVQRELKLRYKQTFFGILWALIPPFMLMVVFNLFFGRFVRVPSEGFPYPVFVFAALLPWNYFAAVVGNATNSVVLNGALVTKVGFPREILPLYYILSGGVDFLVAAAMFGGLLVYFRVPLSWTALFVVPFLLVQVMFMGSVGLILAACNAYYRDVRHAVPFVLQAWMFSSPVIYSTKSIPEWLQPIYLVVNPMAAIVDGYRQVILRRVAPDLEMLAALLVFMVLLFIACYWIFKQAERNMADVV